MPGKKDQGRFGFQPPSEDNTQATEQKLREQVEAQNSIRDVFVKVVKREKALDAAYQPEWKYIGYPARQNKETVLPLLHDYFTRHVTFSTIQAEAKPAFSQTLRKDAADRLRAHYVGALFQDFSILLLKLFYKDDPNITVLSGTQLLELFQAIYPNKPIQKEVFSTLDTLQGVTVPDALIVSNRGTAENPYYTVISEVDVSLRENVDHFQRAVQGLQYRGNSAKGQGRLRKIYDWGCNLLMVTPHDIDLSFTKNKQYPLPVKQFLNSQPLRKMDLEVFFDESRAVI